MFPFLRIGIYFHNHNKRLLFPKITNRYHHGSKWKLFTDLFIFFQTFLVKSLKNVYSLGIYLDFFFQTLPDQSHCYFLMDHESLKGHTVKRIPFSHPSNLIGIITILRQQALLRIGSGPRYASIDCYDA